MSDLQCPVTVLVLRHGQSEGNLTRQLSSAAPGSALTDLGRRQALEAARALTDRNVARVYCSPLLRARQTAALVAELLDVGDPVLLPGVRELELGDCEGSDADEDWARVDAVFDAWLDADLGAALPGAETGREVVQRMRDELEGLADLHRGETVVVVSHGGIMSLALPWLAVNVADDRARASGIANCAVVELEGDSDGWRLLSWPERAPQLGRSPYPGDLVDLVGRADMERNSAPPLGHRPAGAAYAVVEGATCAHLSIPYAWATQASLTGLGPDLADSSRELVPAVVEWLEAQAPGRWHLVVGESQAGAVAARAGLTEQLRLGAWVCEKPPEVVVPQGASSPPALTPPDDVEEFLSIYGSELTAVVEGQLDLPDREFVVVRQDGVAVACARLRDLAGTTYVGGVTVRPDLRGRGWGRAVSALATRRALQRSPLAWLHCADDVSALYARLGYRRVTTHVHLGP